MRIGALPREAEAARIERLVLLEDESLRAQLLGDAPSVLAALSSLISLLHQLTIVADLLHQALGKELDRGKRAGDGEGAGGRRIRFRSARLVGGGERLVDQDGFELGLEPAKAASF